MVKFWLMRGKNVCCHLCISCKNWDDTRIHGCCSVCSCTSIIPGCHYLCLLPPSQYYSCCCKMLSLTCDGRGWINWIQSFYYFFVLQTYFARDQRSGGKKWQCSCEVFIAFAFMCPFLDYNLNLVCNWVHSVSMESTCALLSCSVLTKCHLVWRWAC